MDSSNEMWPGALPLKNGWRLTTEHSLSSYGRPMLVSPEGWVYGPEVLLTVVEAAKARGLKADTLRNRIYAGEVPAVRLYGNLHVKAGDAVRLRDARKTGRPKKGERNG